jgi:magnesium and cobalt exporter, CNNM family
MTSITLEIAIIVLLTIVNGIFAMSEVALLSARKIRLQRLAERGNGNARKALLLLQDPNNFLSTVQVGVTLVGVLSGAFGGATIAEKIAHYLSQYPRIAPYGESIGISIVVLAITYLSLVIGELVPKRLALHSPERVAGMVAGPMSALSRIGAPIVTILSWSTDALLKLFRLQASKEPAVTEDDVRGLLRQGAQTGVFEPAEQQIVERVFQFADRRVSAIMTPRSDIVWLDINDDRGAWRSEISGSPYSRFPVCDGDLDHVIGILHAKEFLTAPETIEIRSLLQPPITVPEQTPALKVLENFRQTTVHIALVIDEYGGVHGLVSSTDILEALVGELPDITPQERSLVQRPDGSWLVDGSVPIEDLKVLLQVPELPGEEDSRFRTIAGFVIYNLHKIPSEGEQFTWEGNRFEVVDMDGNRIDKVLVVPSRAKTVLSA